MSQNPKIKVDGIEGTLLSVKQENMYSEFIVWFPFSKNALKTLREGVLLTAKNYSSTQNEERLSVMQITNAVPSHYALGMAGSEKLDAYPGFLDAALESVHADLDEDRGDESTKILVHASPLNIEIPISTTLSSSTSTPQIIPQDDTSLPMLGSRVNVLTPEMTSMIFNKGIAPNLPQIEIGNLANFDDIKIRVLWQEMIRTHFGVFAYTNAGKSNLTSTYMSKIFAQVERAKAVIYDLQNEYGGLLIDVLCQNEDSFIVYTGENIVDEAVLRYWRDNNEQNLNQAAEVLARTTILPKELSPLKNLFEQPFRQLLKERKIRILGVNIVGNWGTLLEDWKEELYNNVFTLASCAKEDFNLWMTTIINGGEYEGTLPESRTYTAFRNRPLDHESAVELAGIVDHYQEHSAENGKQMKTAMLKLSLQVNLRVAALNPQQNNTVPDRYQISLQDIRDSLNSSDKKSLYVFQGDEGEIRSTSDDLGGIMMESRRRSGRNDPVVSFVYDEADQFIPQQTATVPNSEESKARAVQIARRGRKYGIGLGIGTQRIVFLDTNVLGQPHTYFVSKLPRASDRQTIQEAFGLSNSALDQTHRFKKGQWLLISHSATGIDGEPITVQLPNANERIRDFVTTFNSQTGTSQQNT